MPSKRSSSPAKPPAKSPVRPTARTTVAVQGARVHNLRNISVEIPRDRLVVVTGLSGSGKSSLAFDTIYAEGQRRYMESLSSYAKRFVAQVAKPDVDFVFGLSPVISIEQKTIASNPRSTVGTMTDVASYLNLLFATIGQARCPRTGEPAPIKTPAQLLEAILGLWKPSVFAGFMGAFASQFWFLAFALTAAANVRTLALVEVLFAQAVAYYSFKQPLSARELSGIALIVVGVALLVAV